MSYPSLILAEPSLLAYFRLNETVGSGTVTDSSPNAYTGSTNAGTTLGGASIVPSLADTTVTFSSTAVITGSTGLNSALNFDRTNPFSLECWVKPNVGRGSGAQTQLIFDHRIVTNSQGYVLYLAWNPTFNKTTVNFQLNNNVSTNAIIGNTTTTDLANGNVYHIVLTYDGSLHRGRSKCICEWDIGNLHCMRQTTLAQLLPTLPALELVTRWQQLPWASRAISVKFPSTTPSSLQHRLPNTTTQA